QQTRLAPVVEDIDATAVSDIVCVGIIARPGLFNLVGHAVAPGQVRYLFFAAGQPDRVVIEGIDISLQGVGRIAVRVDTDKHDTHVARRVSQAGQAFGELRHGGGADVRATGVAEE